MIKKRKAVDAERGDQWNLGCGQFDGKRIRIVLESGVYQGLGVYLIDDLLGESLKIRISDDAGSGIPEIIISQDLWDGRILPDIRYGADFCFFPSED